MPEQTITAPNQSSASDPTTSPGNPIEIRVEKLHKSFGDHHVLNGIDFVIARGEIIAIVGDSGGGKSVLLHCLIGQLQPESGRVLLADHESPGDPLVDLATLDKAGLNHLRIHWSIVFQRNALLSGTVYDNLALWLREIKGMDEPEIRERATGVLRSVGLNPDEVLDLDRSELSGGMAKRVAVARALAMDPLLIFYDEPSTGLDPKHSQLIHEMIHSLHHQKTESGRDRTTLIITHDKDLLTRLQPRIIMLHEGRVFFDGPYQAFERSDSPIVRPYFDLMPLLQRRQMLT